MSVYEPKRCQCPLNTSVSLRVQVGAIYSRFTAGFATADLVAAKSLLNELDCGSGKIVQKIYG